MDRYNYAAQQECGATVLADWRLQYDAVFKFYNWPLVQGTGYDCFSYISNMAPRNATGAASLLSIGAAVVVLANLM